MITPTNGALMTVLTACGVRFEEWLRCAGPRYLVLLALGAAGAVVGIYSGV